MSTLPANISDLPFSEKCDLLDALWEDLESHGFPLSPEQDAELDRRATAYEQGNSTPSPWADVKARLGSR